MDKGGMDTRREGEKYTQSLVRGELLKRYSERVFVWLDVTVTVHEVPLELFAFTRSGSPAGMLWVTQNYF
jgi:hypothetical protein